MEVESTVPTPAVRSKPVRPPASIGETPMLPVMTEFGTVEMPALERIANSPALPRRTGSVAVQTHARKASMFAKCMDRPEAASASSSLYDL